MRKFAAVFLIVLAGCLGPGLTADTPAKRLATAELAFKAAVDTANQAIDDGTLDPTGETALVIRSAVLAGNEALKGAHLALRAGNMDAFTARLAIAQSTITALREALLRAQGGP